MTSSRNSRKIRLASLLIACSVAVAFNVAAQDKPRSLFPIPKPSDAAPAAPRLIPPAGTIQTDGEKRVIERSGEKGALVVQSLGGLDAASIGTLDAATGGLGTGMWNGTAPERVVTLLKYLPVVTTSPRMQELTRRLLLTAAAIPQGLEQPTELVQLRLEKLQEAGLVQDASALLAKIPMAIMTPDLARIQANLRLLQGKNAEVCQQAAVQKQQSKGPFWVKVEIFCNLVDGKVERAELGAALLEEQQSADTVFFDLFDRLAGGKSDISDSDEPLTALHYAMARQGEIKIPFSLAKNAGYDVLWALAAQKTADKNDRLRAAYTSLTVGSLGPALSHTLITEGALADAPDGGGLGEIATLYRRAATEIDGAAKARIVGELWAAADRDGSYLAAAKLTLPLLENIPATRQNDEFEIDALRFFLAQGDTANAQKWERQVRRGALRGTNAEREAARKRITRVDAYMLMSGAPGIARWNAANFDLSSFADAENLNKGENAGFLLMVLGEFGEAIPDKLWSEALTVGQVPRASFSNLVIEKNLVLASEAGRVGETVALALTVLGDGGPSKVSTTTLATVLSSLKRIGMEDEARHLAMEAAILRDI